VRLNQRQSEENVDENLVTVPVEPQAMRETASFTTNDQPPKLSHQTRELLSIEEEENEQEKNEQTESLSVRQTFVQTLQTSAAARPASMPGSAIRWTQEMAGIAFSSGGGFVTAGYHYASDYFVSSPASIATAVITPLSLPIPQQPVYWPSPQQPAKNTVSPRDVKVGTYYAVTSEGIPTLQAVGTVYRAQVFPKPAAPATSPAIVLRPTTIDPSPITGDSYNPSSCKPVEFNGRTSVYCEGKKTSIVYTPTLHTHLLQNLDGNIGLAAVGIYWASQGISQVKSLANAASFWCHGSNQPTLAKRKIAIPKVSTVKTDASQQAFTELARCADSLQTDSIAREIKGLKQTFVALEQQVAELQKIRHRLSFQDLHWLKDEVAESLKEWEFTLEQLSASDSTVLDQIKELRKDFVAMQEAFLEIKPVSSSQAVRFFGSVRRSSALLLVIAPSPGATPPLLNRGKEESTKPLEQLSCFF